MSSKQRILFLIICSVIIVVLITIKFKAVNQDNQFKEDQDNYALIVNNFESGNLENASNISTDLLNKYSNSSLLNYVKALIEVQLGNYQTANIHMQKSLSLNPYKVEDSIFMIQLAEILISTGNYTDAKKVLEICSELPKPEQLPNYEEVINSFESIIANNGG